MITKIILNNFEYFNNKKFNNCSWVTVLHSRLILDYRSWQTQYQLRNNLEWLRKIWVSVIKTTRNSLPGRGLRSPSQPNVIGDSSGKRTLALLPSLWQFPILGNPNQITLSSRSRSREAQQKQQADSLTSCWTLTPAPSETLFTECNTFQLQWQAIESSAHRGYESVECRVCVHKGEKGWFRCDFTWVSPYALPQFRWSLTLRDRQLWRLLL